MPSGSSLDFQPVRVPPLDRSASFSRLQELGQPFPEPVPIRLLLKRDDELHPLVSGNKWRKLKYNLPRARQLGHDTLLTYGGAYSNHLFAVAAAGRAFGFRTVGVVRGEDYRDRETPTLAFAREQGMQLHYVTRSAYRQKDEPAFQEALRERFGAFYDLPEGGTNALAIQGTAEIIPEIQQQLGQAPHFVCCPVGTGGTVAGLAASVPAGTQVLGFAVLKGFGPDILNPLEQPPNYPVTNGSVRLVTDYHFGGYAKTTPGLLEFIQAFERQTGVRIEQVYTGKMLYGIYDLARHGFFPAGATVVAVHTGGLQGRHPALGA